MNPNLKANLSPISGSNQPSPASAESHSSPASPKNVQDKKPESSLKEILRFIVIAAIVVTGVRAYIAQPFIVNGASMDPTFDSGQYLIVDQVSYHFENPKRGQVVIFKYPKDPKTFFIKRVIALPGETIKINKGVVTVFSDENPEGVTLVEPYVAQNHVLHDNFSVTLGSTEYFVMGDNRAESSDSRLWGPLDRSFIIGRPILRLFPPQEASIFPGVN